MGVHFSSFFAGTFDPEQMGISPTQVSLAAECLGLMWAVAWSLQAKAPNTTFFLDKKSVLNFAPGRWNLPPLSGLAAALRALVLVCETVSGSQFAHVKAHSEDPFNELVDSLAALVALKVINEPADCPWEPLLRDPRSASWAWLQSLPGQMRLQYPPELNGALVVRSDSVLGTQYPLQTHTHGHHGVPLPRHPQSEAHAAEVEQRSFTLDLTMAFANVLTLQQTRRGKPILTDLYSVGRPRQLAAQFLQAQLDVVGLAETRMPRSGWSQVGDYLALYGPRTPSGSHGCALWFRQKLQWSPGSPTRRSPDITWSSPNHFPPSTASVSRWAPSTWPLSSPTRRTRRRTRVFVRGGGMSSGMRLKGSSSTLSSYSG